MGAAAASVGMHAKDDGWFYICACGATSDVYQGRETARDAYKEHRRTCKLAASKALNVQPEIMSMTANKNESKKTTPRVSKPRTVKTQVEKRAKSEKVERIKDPAFLEKLYNQLKNGETSLIKASKAAGFSNNGQLRKALRDKYGQEKYAALFAAKEKPAKKPKAEKKAKADKPAAKKAAAKKPAAKKAAAKKAAAKKSTGAKKAAAKKSTGAKKAAAEKAPDTSATTLTSAESTDNPTTPTTEGTEA